MDGLARGQVAAPKARKAPGVDEQAAGGNPTSTRCRFCGSEHAESVARAVREKSHIQVVVACGSCGYPFAVLSRN
jgi:transcription elongation factor Elf1